MPNYSPVKTQRETEASSISSSIQRRFGLDSNQNNSVIKILSDTVAQEVRSVNQETRSYLASLNPTNATGEDLDFLLKDVLYKKRREASVAYSNLSERNIYFYTPEVNFAL